MDKRAIIKYCKELGCCDACCLRYLGHRNPGAFENTHEFLKKLLGLEDDHSPELKSVEQSSTAIATPKQSETDTENGENKNENSESVEISADIEDVEEKHVGRNEETMPENTGNDVTVTGNTGNGVNIEKSGTEESKIDQQNKEDEGTPAKRARKSDVCFSCIGVLQEESWPLAVQLAQREMESKGYECSTFACALSAPLATALREKAVSLRLKERFPEHESPVTPLKEAWKWSFCAPQLAARLGLRLESGDVAPLLLAFTMSYAHDEREVNALSSQRGAQCIRNRRQLETCLSSLREVSPAVEPGAPRESAVCTAVRAAHESAYIGGRYVKLSRSLPQTPWEVGGARVLPSSVQEVLFAPIASLYGVPREDVPRRLKLLSAGREDVDVRCLGDGRPFAVEIVDPRFTATEQQLGELAERISQSEEVKVKLLRNVSRSQLGELKRGEQSKLKTYEALCVKLRHTAEDVAAGATPSSVVAVTARDVSRINSLTPDGGELVVQQRTPLRVLHRRPLLVRTRRLHDVRASTVPEWPRLVVLQVVAEAGTYIKEWVHGELRRTTPALADVVPLDILALDVRAVQLDWPPATPT